MKKNPPKIGSKNRWRKTTMTALSTFRHRSAIVPPACRQHGRQRPLQETGQNSIEKNIDDRKDLARKRINLVDISALRNEVRK